MARILQGNYSAYSMLHSFSSVGYGSNPINFHFYPNAGLLEMTKNGRTLGNKAVSTLAAHVYTPGKVPTCFASWVSASPN